MSLQWTCIRLFFLSEVKFSAERGEKILQFCTTYLMQDNGRHLFIGLSKLFIKAMKCFRYFRNNDIYFLNTVVI